MDKIKKLFKKISHKEREKLLDIVKQLKSKNNSNLKTIKIVGTDFYRIRIGKFRIIFHYEDKKVKIDSIKLRDKDTYKGL